MAEVTLEQSPRKVREMFDKAFTLFERGSLDFAIDLFLNVLELEPRLLKAREYVRAAEIKRFKETHANPAVAHQLATVKGLFLSMSGQGKLKKAPLEALAIAEKLMKMDPLNPPFIFFLCKAAEAAGLPEVALQTFEIAHNHYPDQVDFIKNLQRLYSDAQRYHEARECAEKILRLTPNDPMAIKGLKDAAALDTMQRGRWEEEGDFRKGLKDEKEANLLEKKAKAEMAEDDITALIAETRKKIEAEPQNVNYRRALADYYSRAGNFDAALQVLEETQTVTGRADPQVDRAISVTKIKRFDHRIAQLKEAGKAAEAEQIEAEKETFRMTDAADRVRRYPNDLQFHYEYGVLLFEHQRFNEAIEEFQLAQRNPQRRTRALYYLALCFKQKNQFDIALEQLVKASSELSIMDEQKKDVVYEMALLCETLGRADQALEYLKEIYSVDIKYKDVSERIEGYYAKKNP